MNALTFIGIFILVVAAVGALALCWAIKTLDGEMDAPRRFREDEE